MQSSSVRSSGSKSSRIEALEVKTLSGGICTRSIAVPLISIDKWLSPRDEAMENRIRRREMGRNASKELAAGNAERDALAQQVESEQQAENDTIPGDDLLFLLMKHERIFFINDSIVKDDMEPLYLPAGDPHRKGKNHAKRGLR